MKFPKTLGLWGLGSTNNILATWFQKTYQAITLELYHQFPQTGPHVIQNHKLSVIKPSNFKKFCNFAIYGLETTFEPLGNKKSIKRKLLNSTTNFCIQDRILSKIISCFHQNQKLFKKFVALWSGV